MGWIPFQDTWLPKDYQRWPSRMLRDLIWSLARKQLRRTHYCLRMVEEWIRINDRLEERHATIAWLHCVSCLPVISFRFKMFGIEKHLSLTLPHVNPSWLRILSWYSAWFPSRNKRSWPQRLNVWQTFLKKRDYCYQDDTFFAFSQCEPTHESNRQQATAA